MVSTLMEMGFNIEAAHHESSPGQHEIDFKYDDALRSADNIVTFKLVVKVVAKKFGLHATFMPKPLSTEIGHGMHCNMSLFKTGVNAFHDSAGENGLSKEAYWFMGGLMKHARGMAAITNPLVNSYKRLVPGYEAPVYIAWSMANRSPLVRVPVSRGVSTRLELRHPDPSCNPYLALTAMLVSGMDGIRSRIDPPAPVGRNIYTMTDKDLYDAGIERMPANLDQALEAMHRDELIMDALGPHVVENFTRAKNIEWNEYTSAVHPWEIERYLKAY
jgi:glutamine synthetase